MIIMGWMELRYVMGENLARNRKLKNAYIIF